MADERTDERPVGTYTLLVEVFESTTIEVGALGPREFEAGWYAYTGSAFGPGGLGRVDRHRELAAGERDTRHWHVDYLLGHDAVTIDHVIESPGADVECTVSRTLDGTRIEGFGASDCDCPAHLVFNPERDTLLWSIERAHRV